MADRHAGPNVIVGHAASRHSPQMVHLYSVISTTRWTFRFRDARINVRAAAAFLRAHLRG